MIRAPIAPVGWSEGGAGLWRPSGQWRSQGWQRVRAVRIEPHFIYFFIIILSSIVSVGPRVGRPSEVLPGSREDKGGNGRGSKGRTPHSQLATGPPAGQTAPWSATRALEVASPECHCFPDPLLTGHRTGARLTSRAGSPLSLGGHPQVRRWHVACWLRGAVPPPYQAASSRATVNG